MRRRGAFGTLSDEQRLALALTYYGGLSVDMVAERLAAPRQHVLGLRRSRGFRSSTRIPSATLNGIAPRCVDGGQQPSRLHTGDAREPNRRTPVGGLAAELVRPGKRPPLPQRSKVYWPPLARFGLSLAGAGSTWLGCAVKPDSRGGMALLGRIFLPLSMGQEYICLHR